MADPCSTTRDLLDFTGNLEDAFKRANDDKASARKILDAKPVSCETKAHADPKGEAMEKAIRDTFRAFDPIVSAGPPEHTATLRLTFADGGLCSGTAVAPHTLLTATHCVQGTTMKTVNVMPVKERAEADDGNDHTLVIVDQTFDVYVPIVQRKPVQGEDVHYWGNPMNVTDVYRRGYIGGYCNVPQVCMDLDADAPLRSGPWRGEAYMLVVPGAPGDSGSGIFDTDGEVIGVVSAIQLVGGTLGVMEGLPLAFAPAILGSMQ